MSAAKKDPFRRARKRCALCGQRVHSQAYVELPICGACAKGVGSRVRARKIARDEREKR